MKLQFKKGILSYLLVALPLLGLFFYGLSTHDNIVAIVSAIAGTCLSYGTEWK